METTRCKSSTLANFPWLRLSTIWWRDKQFTNTKIRLFSSGWSNFLRITHHLWKSWNALACRGLILMKSAGQLRTVSQNVDGTWIQKPVRYSTGACATMEINHWISHSVIAYAAKRNAKKQRCTSAETTVTPQVSIIYRPVTTPIININIHHLPSHNQAWQWKIHHSVRCHLYM